MDSGWTPGAGGRQKPRAGATKDTLDDLLGDLLEDEPPKKKSAPVTSGKQQYGAKKQSSKDEDFYSSLALAAEDDNVSDVSEADVNQMAKSIADLDDLDADLFQAGSSVTNKPSKRGSLKDKTGKPGTPRRGGTPRSRGSTPRASSPPLRLTSPANRVVSPAHQRVTSPPAGRGTPPGRETPSAASSIDRNRPGSGSRASPASKPMSPPPPVTPEYKPSTAPGKMTDLSERASVSLKPGNTQEQERPQTVPKASKMSFGDFDEDDPLAGIPLSDDDDDDLGLPVKKKAVARQPSLTKTEMPAQQKTEEPSPRGVQEQNKESVRQRNLLDRPPTRSGGSKSEVSEKVEPAPQKPKPALVKKKSSEDNIFSDNDDDFLGGLGIEEKQETKPKAKPTEIEEEENRPAKSIMDKLLNKDSVSKHLETKEKREFVLDTKYTQLQKQGAGEGEEDYMFGSYMPSAVASNTSSRPTSRRSVRFQDDDDIFGLNDAPVRTRSPPRKSAEDAMDWLEMATAGKTTDKPKEKPQTPEKPAIKPPDPLDSIKPKSDPTSWLGIKDDNKTENAGNKSEAKPAVTAKPKSDPSDWLGLKDNDDNDEFDYLKTSSFSAPARQGPPQINPSAEEKRPQTQPGPKAPSPVPSKPTPKSQDLGPQTETKGPAAGSGKDDYLGLGDEVDPNRLLRSKSPSPALGGGIDKSDYFDEDIFSPPKQMTDQPLTEKQTPDKSLDRNRSQSPAVTQDKDVKKDESSEQTSAKQKSQFSRGRPLFESAARRAQMTMSPISPRSKGSPRSPERRGKKDEPSPRSLAAQMQQMEATKHHPKPAGPLPEDTDKTEPFEPVEDEQDLNASTDFFSFKSGPKRDRGPASGQTGQQLQSGSRLSQSQYQMDNQQFQAGPGFYPDQMDGSQFMQPSSQQMQRQQQWRQQQYMKQQQYQRQQFQRQQQQQFQQQRQFQQPMMNMQDSQMFMFDRPLFADDMGIPMDIDAEAKIRRLEVELQYARDILTSTKRRYDEEVAARDQSYKVQMQLIEETSEKKEQRWRDEHDRLQQQMLNKDRQMDEERSELIAANYKKLEEYQREKSEEIERLKEIHRQALERIKKDHEETLAQLKRSKDQQIEAVAASHDTSRSLMATVELIQNNAKDLGELQRKMDSWHAQGLDEREIMIKSKDEQLRMLQERLNKQQEDNDLERQRLQDLIARLETQIREQTRMLEDERWKVKQEQGRLQSLQTALEDERKMWMDQQARERSNMEKSREALLEEQKSTLAQLHRERQALEEEKVQFNMKAKMSKEEHSQYSIKATQAKAEFEALTRAIAEARDRYEAQKEENKHEESRMQEERRRLDKERNKIEAKEAELMEAANMVQERSREMDEMFSESQMKYQEGMSALAEAQRIEGEEAKRIDTINQQLNTLRIKEKEMTEERLRLSKEKREVEKLKNTLLCPNCRHPTRHVANGNLNESQTQSPSESLLMPANVYQNGIPNGIMGNNGLLAPGLMPGGFGGLTPAMQLSVNTVDAVTESIKSDRTIRMWKVEAMKDQKYLEEQSLFLQTLKHMPYSSPKG